VPLPADPPAVAAPPSRARAYALLPLVVLLWGVNWPAMKVGLEYVPPFWFATLLGVLQRFRARLSREVLDRLMRSAGVLFILLGLGVAARLVVRL